MFGWWSSPTAHEIPEGGKKSAETEGKAGTSDLPKSQDGEQSEKTEENLSSEQDKKSSGADDKGEKHSELDYAKDVAKNVGSLLFSFASVATTTAFKVKDTVKDTVEKQTFIGNFNKEQEQFLKEKERRKTDAAIPPWVGYNEEEAMKTQILALSSDERNFLRDPPAGVPFHFDSDSMFPVAMATLAEDENLSEMRFRLVPKKIKEEKFWRNYFYRVSLIKQSTQLTSLAATTGTGNTASSTSGKVSPEGESKSEIQRPSDKDIPQPSKPNSQLEDLPPDSPPHQEHEFVSDEHQEASQSELSHDDLRQIGVERLQLAQDKSSEKDGAIPSKRASTDVAVDEDVPEWEKELQQELQDYEVVEGDDNAAWEKEIEDMLEAET